MSLDITSRSAEVPPTAIALSEVPIDLDAVYAFDFDGVVSSSQDDDVYHLQTWDGEADLLARVATTLGVNCQGMELKYQRHLLYQAAACICGIPIVGGVGLRLLKDVAGPGRVFIITARSGWYAVERMRQFLTSHGLAPVEVFNLGRVKKDRQIDLLCREYPDRKIFYLEDSAAHLDAMSILEHRNLVLVWASRAVNREPQGELQKLVQDTLERVLA